MGEARRGLGCASYGMACRYAESSGMPSCVTLGVLRALRLAPNSKSKSKSNPMPPILPLVQHPPPTPKQTLEQVTFLWWGGGVGVWPS